VPACDDEGSVPAAPAHPARQRSWGAARVVVWGAPCAQLLHSFAPSWPLCNVSSQRLCQLSRSTNPSRTMSVAVASAALAVACGVVALAAPTPRNSSAPTPRNISARDARKVHVPSLKGSYCCVAMLTAAPPPRRQLQPSPHAPPPGGRTPAATAECSRRARCCAHVTAVYMCAASSVARGCVAAEDAAVHAFNM
jgi:hypothetical protein